MSNYVIHACPERMWYVDNYLVPSMQEQGIDVDVRCDTKHEGCLESCMKIFASMPEDGGTWHLQDDVIVCRNFKKLTEEHEGNRVVCGYWWEYDEHEKIGLVLPKNMRWSFPCIYIPNKLARECADWYYKGARYSAKYRMWVEARKFDDSMFQEFLILNHATNKVHNLNKSLVDHIDFLIGGTVVNKIRTDSETRAKCFPDLDLVEELKYKLEMRENKFVRLETK